jgi:hypothetical protein
MSDAALLGVDPFIVGRGVCVDRSLGLTVGTKTGFDGVEKVGTNDKLVAFVGRNDALGAGETDGPNIGMDVTLSLVVIVGAFVDGSRELTTAGLDVPKSLGLMVWVPFPIGGSDGSDVGPRISPRVGTEVEISLGNTVPFPLIGVGAIDRAFEGRLDVISLGKRVGVSCGNAVWFGVGTRELTDVVEVVGMSDCSKIIGFETGVSLAGTKTVGSFVDGLNEPAVGKELGAADSGEVPGSIVVRLSDNEGMVDSLTGCVAWTLVGSKETDGRRLYLEGPPKTVGVIDGPKDSIFGVSDMGNNGDDGMAGCQEPIIGLFSGRPKYSEGLKVSSFPIEDDIGCADTNVGIRRVKNWSVGVDVKTVISWSLGVGTIENRIGARVGLLTGESGITALVVAIAATVTPVTVTTETAVVEVRADVTTVVAAVAAVVVVVVPPVAAAQ